MPSCGKASRRGIEISPMMSDYDDSQSFTVPGKPVPAVRMTQRSKWSNPQAKRYLAYKEQVGWLAKDAGIRQREGPVLVTIDVFLKNRMGRRGDIDNLAKAITDGLNGIAYQDDKQITRLTISLRSAGAGEERSEVWISEAA